MATEHEASLAPAIISQAADAVIFADREGKIRIWNKAAVALFGFAADATIGQSLDIVIPEKLRAAHWAGFRQAMESGRTRLAGRPTITRALHASGKRLYVELSFAVVGDTAGGAVGSVAIARDVTERYEKEKNKQPGAR